MMQFVLIETLWNVKVSEAKEKTALYNVLIETLWNVKTVVGVENASVIGVLIETLWNVKSSRKSCLSITAGFNRNIVECKGS